MYEYLKLFISSLEETGNASKNTISAYKTDLKQFIDYLMEKGVAKLNKVTETRVNAYLLFLKKNGKTEATVTRSLIAIRKFFGYLDHIRVVDENPALNIRTVTVSKTTPYILTQSEMNRFLDSIPHDTLKGKRDRAIMELLYATGIKVSELITLKREQVNLRIGYITVTSDKTERVLPLYESAKEALKSYLTELGKQDLLTEDLFVNRNKQQFTRQGIWKLVKEYGKLSNMPKQFSIQTMRNSFASHLLNNGADAGSVQEMMGIKSSANLLRYMASEETETFKNYKKSHPRA